VTHDQALASEAQRQVILRDGLVVSDNLNRRDAETERISDTVSIG
jgi:hypothetical protein